MARSDTLRADIVRLETKGATLTRDLARVRDEAQKAAAAAAKKRAEAARTKTPTTARSATSAAEREEKRHAAALLKASDAERRIAENHKAIGSKQSSLTAALKSEQQERDRVDTRRRTTEKNHARDLVRLAGSRAVIRYVEVPEPSPEPLRVLYLTANPHAVETTVTHPDGTVTTHGTWLRVDQEVRQVKDQIRKSPFREMVTVEHVPAATAMDLLDGLNHHRPHVVHFSGHADALGLLLEDDAGTTDGNGLDFAVFARLLGATDQPPVLLVLNACESLTGADDLLPTVPVVIAMSDEIHDASAIVFAARFYAGIAAAQSVASALEQAEAAMAAASLGGADLPEARTREGVDLHTLVLVQPTGRAMPS